MKPKSVSIFGRTVPITYIKLEDDYGQYCVKEERIEIARNCPQHKFVAILFHECFHAMCDRMGWNRAGLTEEVEELIATSLETWLEEQNIFVVRMATEEDFE